MENKKLNSKNTAQLKSWLAKLETYGTHRKHWPEESETEYQALQAYLIILKTDLEKLPQLSDSLSKLEQQLLQTWQEEHSFDITLQQFRKEDFALTSISELDLLEEVTNHSVDSIVQSNLKFNASHSTSLLDTIKHDIKSLFQDLFPKRERWVSLPLIVAMSLLLFTFSWSYVPPLLNITNSTTSVEIDSLEITTISDSSTFLSSELWTTDLSSDEE